MIKCISASLFMCAHFSNHRQNHYHCDFFHSPVGHFVFIFFCSTHCTSLRFTLFFIIITRIYFNFSLSLGNFMETVSFFYTRSSHIYFNKYCRFGLGIKALAARCCCGCTITESHFRFYKCGRKF